MDVNEAVPNVRKTTTEMRVQSRQLEQVPHRRYKKKNQNQNGVSKFPMRETRKRKCNKIDAKELSNQAGQFGYEPVKGRGL